MYRLFPIQRKHWGSHLHLKLRFSVRALFRPAAATRSTVDSLSCPPLLLPPVGGRLRSPPCSFLLLLGGRRSMVNCLNVEAYDQGLTRTFSYRSADDCRRLDPRSKALGDQRALFLAGDSRRCRSHMFLGSCAAGDGQQSQMPTAELFTPVNNQQS